MRKDCLTCKYEMDAVDTRPCFDCHNFLLWKPQEKQESVSKKENIFDLVYSLYSLKNNLPRDYTKYSFAHKCGMLKDVAAALNGPWRPNPEDDSQEKRYLVANMRHQMVEVWESDPSVIDQSVLFSVEAAAEAQDIIPFDFLKLFWG
jgi:hypothetical protein